MVQASIGTAEAASSHHLFDSKENLYERIWWKSNYSFCFQKGTEVFAFYGSQQTNGFFVIDYKKQILLFNDGQTDLTEI